jgi:hypothetical protein
MFFLLLSFGLFAQQQELTFYETYSWPSSNVESVVWASMDDEAGLLIELDDIRNIFGSRELTLATWIAQANEKGINPDRIPGKYVTGIGVRRQIYYDARLHDFFVRVIDFGPTVSEGKPALWLNEQLDLSLSLEQARFGPLRYDWIGRTQSRLGNQSLKQLSWTLEEIILEEIQTGALVSEQIDEPENWNGNPQENPINLIEEWFFDARSMTMYSRVVEILYFDGEAYHRVLLTDRSE